MTGRARDAIAGADCIIGNGLYLDQIAPLLPGKEIIRSSMGKEVERARQAVELACSRPVAVVSGGIPVSMGWHPSCLRSWNTRASIFRWRWCPG